MDFPPEDVTMNNKFIIKLFVLVLVFGLCITMRGKGVKVYAAENEVKLNVSEVSIIIDGSYRLKVYNLSRGQKVTYRSADPNIAAVSNTGKVTGISCGNTVVTAIVMEAGAPVATLQCDVLIGPAAVSIRLTKTELVLLEGKMKALKTIIFPLNTVETATFYSADPSVAKVSSAGCVRAEAEGNVQVYAFLSNGQSAVCDVTVLSVENYEKYLEGVSIEELLTEDEEVTEEGTVPVEGEPVKTEPTENVVSVSGSAILGN